MSLYKVSKYFLACHWQLYLAWNLLHDILLLFTRREKVYNYIVLEILWGHVPFKCKWHMPNPGNLFIIGCKEKKNLKQRNWMVWYWSQNLSASSWRGWAKSQCKASEGGKIWQKCSARLSRGTSFEYDWFSEFHRPPAINNGHSLSSRVFLKQKLCVLNINPFAALARRYLRATLIRV